MLLTSCPCILTFILELKLVLLYMHSVRLSVDDFLYKMIYILRPNDTMCVLKYIVIFV